MKFFIDTANVDEIRKANDMGVISGVTTNPSLIAKEHKDYAKTLAEIASIVDGPISGEVKATTTDAETMVKEGEAIYALDPKHMVVKIPMTVEGLKAIKALSAKGIPTNCTLIFSANQALLAARAGAAYVSPFLGRLDDISQPGIDLVRTISEIFANYPDIHTQIIAASVRNPIHITECALAGADIATVPYKVIEQMTKHPLTDQGIEKFKADHTAVFGAKEQNKKAADRRACRFCCIRDDQKIFTSSLSIKAAPAKPAASSWPSCLPSFLPCGRTVTLYVSRRVAARLRTAVKSASLP